MRIICSIHGAQSCKLVSPDLLAEPAHTDVHNNLIEITYKYEGETVVAYQMSSTFASTHGIEAGAFPLPNDYPKWVHLLVTVCTKCFKDKATPKVHTPAGSRGLSLSHTCASHSGDGTP